MNKKTFACLAAIVVSVPAAWAQVQPTVLTIQVDQPISKVSPTLYGLMTEEINYSYDRGAVWGNGAQSHLPLPTAGCAALVARRRRKRRG